MALHPLAGKPAPPELLIDVRQLEREYFERQPDLGDPNQLVSFGTSGHRGTPSAGTFTEAHILAIAQATAEGLRRVAETIQVPGGQEAVQLRVAEQYIGKFGELAKTTNTLILPASVSDVGSMIALAMNAIRQTGMSAPVKS